MTAQERIENLERLLREISAVFSTKLCEISRLQEQKKDLEDRLAVAEDTIADLVHSARAKQPVAHDRLASM